MLDLLVLGGARRERRGVGAARLEAPPARNHARRSVAHVAVESEAHRGGDRGADHARLDLGRAYHRDADDIGLQPAPCLRSRASAGHAQFGGTRARRGLRELEDVAHCHRHPFQHGPKEIVGRAAAADVVKGAAHIASPHRRALAREIGQEDRTLRTLRPASDALDGVLEPAAHSKDRVAPLRAIGAGLRRPADLMRMLRPGERHESRHRDAVNRDETDDFRRARDIVGLARSHRTRAHGRRPRIHRPREDGYACEARENTGDGLHHADLMPWRKELALHQWRVVERAGFPRMRDAVAREHARQPQVEKILGLDDCLDLLEPRRLMTLDPGEARWRIECGDAVDRHFAHEVGCAAVAKEYRRSERTLPAIEQHLRAGETANAHAKHAARARQGTEHARGGRKQRFPPALRVGFRPARPRLGHGKRDGGGRGDAAVDPHETRAKRPRADVHRQDELVSHRRIMKGSRVKLHAGDDMPPTAPAATIVAIATPPGRGGIGIVRVSGTNLDALLEGVAGSIPRARLATLAEFRDADGDMIDHGIVLYFPAPNSYTGEAVAEFHGHGGPAVMRLLLMRCVELGARIAEPGEFTKRAFLNGKLDLAQAESVADLIDAATATAARAAARSLAGEFSREIHAMVDALTELRAYTEATLDFPEEDIEFLRAGDVEARLAALRGSLARVLSRARAGALLRDGLTVVLAGRPNVGKSSLLNRLVREEAAIVTPIPGTTRDPVERRVEIAGIPLTVVDTAGLRETGDAVERIGIERTWAAVERADLVLLLVDARETATALHDDDRAILARLPPALPRVVVHNKCDLAGVAPHAQGHDVWLCARDGQGVELLAPAVLDLVGAAGDTEDTYLARERHVAALVDAADHLERAAAHVAANPPPIELFAEELREAQNALSSITGEFTADDLLGAIFGRFCIGK